MPTVSCWWCQADFGCGSSALVALEISGSSWTGTASVSVTTTRAAPAISILIRLIVAMFAARTNSAESAGSNRMMLHNAAGCRSAGLDAGRQRGHRTGRAQPRGYRRSHKASESSPPREIANPILGQQHERDARNAYQDAGGSRPGARGANRRVPPRQLATLE